MPAQFKLAPPQPTMAERQQQQQQMGTFLEAIARYNEYGKALQRATTMREVAERLSQIAEMAETAVVTEADDWFDAHTLKRNMKEIKGYAGEFMKFAEEADTLNQRMTALYDDMGRVLERYFEIPELSEEQPQHVATGLPQTREEPAPKTLKTEELPPQKEMKPRPVKEKPPAAETHDAASDDSKLKKKDELTIRAIKAVYNLLKNENPELAERFRKLPPKKMIEGVWKLVK